MKIHLRHFKSVVWGGGVRSNLRSALQDRGVAQSKYSRSQKYRRSQNISAGTLPARRTVLHARVSKPPGSIIGRDDGGRDEPASKTIGPHSLPRCRAR